MKPGWMSILRLDGGTELRVLAADPLPPEPPQAVAAMATRRSAACLMSRTTAIAASGFPLR
jgi:hypothetical protein